MRASFAQAKALGDQAAAPLHERLFALDPSLRALSKRDPAVQRAKLLAALATVVDALDRLHGLLPAVRNLGRRHARSGVLPEHYATVGSALIWTLEQRLGAAFTPAARRAWIDAYDLLAWTMLAAAEAELRDAAA